MREKAHISWTCFIIKEWVLFTSYSHVYSMCSSGRHVG